jgi:hypothetical protein
MKKVLLILMVFLLAIALVLSFGVAPAQAGGDNQLTGIVVTGLTGAAILAASSRSDWLKNKIASYLNSGVLKAQRFVLDITSRVTQWSYSIGVNRLRIRFTGWQTPLQFPM